MPCLLPNVLRDHPDWYNVNAKGESAATKRAYVGYYKFLDPAHPDVRAFVRDTVRELAAIPGLTGIHLDYIRHPDAILPSDLWATYGIVQDKVYPPYDYGYTELSRNAFKASHGIDPITLADPESNRAWLDYRLDTVVDLVNDYLVPAARAGGKQITAAVFPGPCLARTMVRQDWGRFQLDAYFPMLYHTFYKAGPVMRLEKIDPAVFARFVEARFTSGGVRPGEGLGEAIVELAANVPYDVQRLAHETWDDVRAGGRRRATGEDLHTTLDAFT